MINYLVYFTIIIFFLMFIALVVNINKKKILIKVLSLFMALFVFSIIVYYNLDFWNKVAFDLIKYLYYPSYNAYILTLFITIMIFVYNVFNDKIIRQIRLFNYIFSLLIFLSYFVFFLLKVDQGSYIALYTNEALICLRYATCSFSLWMIALTIWKFYRYLLAKRWYL